MMELKLNGYQVNIIRIYEGQLAGQIDTKYHNRCEEKAKDELRNFGRMEDAYMEQNNARYIR